MIDVFLFHRVIPGMKKVRCKSGGADGNIRRKMRCKRPMDLSRRDCAPIRTARAVRRGDCAHISQCVYAGIRPAAAGDTAGHTEHPTRGPCEDLLDAGTVFLALKSAVRRAHILYF